MKALDDIDAKSDWRSSGLGRMLRANSGTKGFTHKNGTTVMAAYLGRFVLLPFDALYRYYQNLSINDEINFPQNLSKTDFSAWIYEDRNRKIYFETIFPIIDFRNNPESNKEYNPELIELQEEITHHFSMHSTQWWSVIEFIAYLKRALTASVTQSYASRATIASKQGGALIELTIIQHAMIDILRPIVEGQMHCKEYGADSSGRTREIIYGSYGSATVKICEALSSFMATVEKLKESNPENIVRRLVYQSLQTVNIKKIFKKLISCQAKDVKFEIENSRNLLYSELIKQIHAYENKRNVVCSTDHSRKANRVISLLTRKYILGQSGFITFVIWQLMTSYQAQKRLLAYFLGLLRLKKEGKVYNYPASRMYTLDGAHRSYDPLVVKSGRGEVGHAGFESVFRITGDEKKYYHIMPYIYYFVNILAAGIIEENFKLDLELGRQLNPKFEEYYYDVYGWAGMIVAAIAKLSDKAVLSNMSYTQLFAEIIFLAETESSKAMDDPQNRLWQGVERYLEMQFIHGG